MILSASSVVTATAVRGTLIASSLQAMRSQGLEDHYFAVLEPEYERMIRELLVRSWIPMDVANAHYQAMDSLGYARQEMVDNGSAVGDRIQGTFLGTVLRQLSATGVLDIWAAVPKLPKAWGRIVQGGAITVGRLGPKEAHLGIHGLKLTEIEYFCAGLEGLALATMQVLHKAAYVRQIGAPKAGYVAYRISWV